MKIAVAGPTGVAGSKITAELKSRQIEMVPISRADGVNLVTGAGLVDALKGCDVVIDASSPVDPELPKDVATVEAAKHMVAACKEAGVKRLVVLSIHGIDDAGFDAFPYYVAKREQEQVALSSGLPTVIVRSAQWFEFAMNPAAVTEDGDTVTVSDWLIQPIAVASVARVLVDEALGSTTGTVSIAGPTSMGLPELTARYLETQGDERTVVPAEPGIDAFSSGALLADENTRLIEPTLDEWLATIN